MKEELINHIKIAAECNELPLMMKGKFFMPVVKNNAKYFELRNSRRKYVEATVYVYYYNDSDNVPVMIIKGYNDRFQDFYYDNKCWKILSVNNPVDEWVNHDIKLEVPDYLINNFAAGNLIGFFKNAEECK